MFTFIRGIVVAIAVFIAAIFAVPEPTIEAPVATAPENTKATPSPVSTTKEEPEVEEEPVRPIKERPEIVVVEKSDKESISVEIDSGLVDLIVPLPPIEPTPTISTTEINTKARNALVNIICTTAQGGLLQPITGSGIIIDSKGVILTNAHIAQYFLLTDYIAPGYLDCNIRTGSPAVNTYDAELLYISPSWIRENYSQINSQNPKGTGENDFALLLITKSIRQGVTLPKTFPFVSPDLRDLEPEVGDYTLVAGYPAGFLSGQAIQKDLYAVSTIAEVMDVFTFSKKTLDLFSIGGSIAAQKGSSGGGVLNLNGELSGIVVTASDATQTDNRDLRAITLSHINRSLENETGFGLKNYLLGDLKIKSNQFNLDTAPLLTSLLESALNN